jgi:plasmid stabilization system protein ParE
VPKPLILTEDAQQDLDDAHQWYQEQNLGLGQEFMRCVDAKLSELNRNPPHYKIIYGNLVRRALTNRFPFSIYFAAEDELVTVFAILDQRRSPQSWKSCT